MHRTILATGAVGVALLLTAAVAEARPRHHGPPGGFIRHHGEQLGLDEAQQETIEGLVDESMEQGQVLREELRGLRGQLHDLLAQDPPDSEAVMELADQMGQAETELHKLRLGTMIAIGETLTPEQRESLQELRGSLREFGGRHLDEACSDDVARLCPDAADGLARAHCLRENREGLSEQCSDALDCSRRHHMKGPGRGFFRRFHGEPEAAQPL